MPYTLKGFLSIGDWIYEGDAITRVQDEDQNVLSTESKENLSANSTSRPNPAVN